MIGLRLCFGHVLLVMYCICLAHNRTGSLFDPAVHECGTEVKAITYSAMKVVQGSERTDAYVIVDI